MNKKNNDTATAQSVAVGLSLGSLFGILGGLLLENIALGMSLGLSLGTLGGIVAGTLKK